MKIRAYAGAYACGAVIRKLLGALIGGEGGEQRETTCYCLVSLRNAFNLHAVGSLHSKTLQLPEITYSQHQQNPFSKRGKCHFKDLIFAPHRNSPEDS